MPKDLLQEICDCKDNVQLVIAGAGTGKTHTVVHVLAHRIRTGIIRPGAKNESIIVFTFTNNAAEELKVRLAQQLGPMKQMLNNIYVGTIHGWCNDYLSNHAFLANTKVLDELEQLQLLQRVYGVIGIDKLYGQQYKFGKIEQFRRDLEVYYNDSLEVTDPRIPKDVASIISRYQQLLREERLIDFGNLIRSAMQYAKKDATLGCCHVFVDEYQDINNAQAELIQTLVSCSKNGQFLAVGDPRQAIYQWRGSDVSRILEFKKKFPTVRVFNLTTNRRSREGIVRVANVVSSKMHLKAGYKIEDMKVYDDLVDEKASVLIDTTNKNHAQKVVSIIKELRSQDVDYSDIAVLMRSVLNDGMEIMNALKKEGIPYSSPNANRGLKFVEDFMLAIIRLFELYSAGPPQNKEEEDERTQEIKSILNTIKTFCTGSSEQVKKELTHWFIQLKLPQKKKASAVFFKNEQYNFRRQLFDFCENAGVRIEPEDVELQEGFSAVTQIMRAVEEVYRRRFDKTSNWRDTPLDVFTHNLQWHLSEEIHRWSEVGLNVTPNKGVVISTIHAAKGLEWPVVIIPFLWKNRMPLPQKSYKTTLAGEFALRYGTTIDDERRLWYVALTRARDLLYMCAGETEGRITSPFVSELLENLPKGVLCGDYAKTSISKVRKFQRAYYCTLGVSDLLLLLECPYHFYLRHVVGVNVPVGEEFGAGNIVHRAIKRIKSENLTDVNKITKEEVYLPLGEKETEVAVGKSVQKKLKELLKSRILEKINDTEFQFSLLLGNFLLTGIVDATLDTGNGIEIIDWKNSVHDQFKERYRNQILVYALGLINMGIPIVQGRIFDLSHISKGHTVKVTKSTLDEVRTTTMQRFKDISQTRITVTPSKNACSICDVKEVCKYCMVRRSPDATRK